MVSHTGHQADIPASMKKDDATAEVVGQVELADLQQQNVLEAARTGGNWNELLKQYVGEKVLQADTLIDRLENAEQQELQKLSALQDQIPGFLSLPGQKKKWLENLSAQQEKIRKIQNRKQRVDYIRDGMGIDKTLIDEMAEQRLRKERPELAELHDEMQVSLRMEQIRKVQDAAKKRSREQEREQGRARRLIIGNGLSE